MVFRLDPFIVDLIRQPFAIIPMITTILSPSFVILAPQHRLRRTNQCLLLCRQPYLPIVLIIWREKRLFRFQVFQDHLFNCLAC